MNTEIKPDASDAPPSPGGPPSEDKKTRAVRIEVSSGTVVQLVLVVACLWLLIKLWPVFLVLVVALLIVGTMSPAVSWMETRRVKRGLAIGIVFSLFFVAATLVLMLTIPTLVSQATALVEQEPALRTRLVDYLEHSNLTAPLAVWLRDVKSDAVSSAIRASAFSVSMRIFEVSAYFASAIFLALYIMIDRDRLLLAGSILQIEPKH